MEIVTLRIRSSYRENESLLMEISQSSLSDDDKVRLFDKAAAKASSDSATANAAVAMATESIEDEEEQVIELTTAYSLIANNPVSQSSEMYMDSGTNRDIFNDSNKFLELHSIRPV